MELGNTEMAPPVTQAPNAIQCFVGGHLSPGDNWGAPGSGVDRLPVKSEEEGRDVVSTVPAPEELSRFPEH